MTFIMPNAQGFLALIVIAFVAGFFWAAGTYVFGKVVSYKRT